MLAGSPPMSHRSDCREPTKSLHRQHTEPMSKLSSDARLYSMTTASARANRDRPLRTLQRGPRLSRPRHTAIVAAAPLMPAAYFALPISDAYALRATWAGAHG